jgi:3-phenylpropionate/cinnamic acid dioxygenase small subunit
MRDERIDVAEVVYSYATGVDSRDWGLYRSIFSDEVEIDFSSWDPGNVARRMTADEWVAGVRPLFMGLDATQHSMSNPRVSIAGERATCVMYMQAAHFLHNDEGDAEFTLGGYYTDQLVKTPAGWKLCGVKLTVTWSRGNKHIMTLAAQRGMKAPRA